MSTNSFIAYKENNKITGIYCHWDGYLEYNGAMLQALYPKHRAKALVALGDISSLGGKLTLEEPDFEPKPNYSKIVQKYMQRPTKAYHRDAHEDWDDVQPCEFTSVEDYRKYIIDDGCLEFAYLFNADDDDTAPYNTWSYITPEQPDKFETF